MTANRIASEGTSRFAASHLVLFCLPMSHKKDASLIWVNVVLVLISLLVSNVRNNFVFKLLFIMQTCPCNEHPLTPHLYIVKLGLTGYTLFSYF